MCETCGCHNHHEHHEHKRHHDHDDGSSDSHRHHHHHDDKSTQISIDDPVLAANDRLADQNKTLLAAKGCYTINLISSPGSGKTSLLEVCAKRYGGQMAVIEGDVNTRRDAERIISQGCQAYQIETGGACHLDARSVGVALSQMALDGCRLLVVENVGNLVCPATYNLGENEKIAILSTPEGDDKILKYPALFYRISALVINKIDLIPYLNFDLHRVVAECRGLNGSCRIFPLSTVTGEGTDLFFEYLHSVSGVS